MYEKTNYECFIHNTIYFIIQYWNDWLSANKKLNFHFWFIVIIAKLSQFGPSFEKSLIHRSASLGNSTTFGTSLTICSVFMCLLHFIVSLILWCFRFICIPTFSCQVNPIRPLWAFQVPSQCCVYLSFTLISTLQV
jgi:hypothetical protein